MNRISGVIVLCTVVALVAISVYVLLDNDDENPLDDLELKEGMTFRFADNGDCHEKRILSIEDGIVAYKYDTSPEEFSCSTEDFLSRLCMLEGGLKFTQTYDHSENFETTFGTLQVDVYKIVFEDLDYPSERYSYLFNGIQVRYICSVYFDGQWVQLSDASLESVGEYIEY